MYSVPFRTKAMSSASRIDNLSLREVGGLNELATPWYADQILPFDVTLAGANEYGAMTTFHPAFGALQHLLIPLPKDGSSDTSSPHESGLLWLLQGWQKHRYFSGLR